MMAQNAMTTSMTTPPTASADMESDFAAARRAMIDSQLRTSGVNTPFVLERMGTLPREDYVPAAARAAAYVDRAIRLEDGRGFLPAPLFHGKMLEEAAPDAEDTVLIVDGGSGYLAELVRPLVAKVEVVDSAAGAAGKTKGKGFSLLLIDGAVQQIPEKLVKRCATGARAVTGITENNVTRLAAGLVVAPQTGVRGKAKLALTPLAEIGVPRLPAFDVAEEWSF
jgi:protein-L-isoaspartate(D-aspartate) O-methyltransferase